MGFGLILTGKVTVIYVSFTLDLDNGLMAKVIPFYS